MNCFLHTILKRQAMVCFFLLSLLCGGRGIGFADSFENSFQTLALASEDLTENNESHVFRTEGGGSSKNYHKALDKLIGGFEETGRVKIQPQLYPKIAIKLETRLAPGLQVSPKLVDALLEILRLRGFQKSQIVLVDYDRRTLERAGFVDGTSAELSYKGHRVFSFTAQEYRKPDWFHDSPMPPAVHDRASYFLRYPTDAAKRAEEERKSYLPTILFLDDFNWINLAVAMDDSNLGLDGASANLSLGAINNSTRFIQKPTIAPAAVAEILAIPEIWEKRIFSLVDLARFQFAGGQSFDAEFIGKSSSLVLGENPFCVDYVTWVELSKIRKISEFAHRSRKNALLFKYAQELGLGPVFSVRVHDL